MSLKVMDGVEFLQFLDEETEPLKQELINSDFVKAWCSGKLSKESILEIQKQFYCLARNVTENFALWAVTCPFDDVKEYFYQQTVEEYEHPRLLLDFAREWGYDESVMRKAQPLPSWGAVYYYYQYLATKHPVERVAAQNYASEGTVPWYFEPMGQAALDYYGATKDSAFYHWFGDHIEADGETHSPMGRKILEKYCVTPELQEKALYAAKHTLEMEIIAFNDFYHTFCK